MSYGYDGDGGISVVCLGCGERIQYMDLVSHFDDGYVHASCLEDYIENLVDECDQLKTLLTHARSQLSVAASYADYPEELTAGLLIHAKACAQVVAAIDAVLPKET